VRLLIILLISVFFSYTNNAESKTVKQYQKEISSKSKELKKIEKSIKEKEKEKEEYRKKEKEIRVELDELKKELKKLRKEADVLSKSIKKAEKNLQKAEKQLKLAGWEKSQWKNTINSELDLWFRDHASCYKIYRAPVVEKLRMDALEQKKEFLGRAERREYYSKEALKKWKKAQEKLVNLKKQKEESLKKQKTVRRKKERLLESAIGKRIVAEEEIKELSSTAVAMQQLMKKLLKEKKKTEQELLAKKEFKKKRRQLPWPVKGKLITKFGKNKHPELDTYLISNGIKIEARKGAPVIAVSKGEIIFCGEFRAYGQMIIIDHNGGFYTVYGMLEDILVEENQKVDAYEQIGSITSEEDPVLYFEVRVDSKPEDPLLWLK
jgi:septal ring factor EnvC (AmiA/AmiB activator)